MDKVEYDWLLVSKTFINNSKGGQIVIAVAEITAYVLIYVNYMGCHGVYCSYSVTFWVLIYEKRIQLVTSLKRF